MIRNKVEYIKEEEIYEEINILVKKYQADEYMERDGKSYKTTNNQTDEYIYIYI